MDVVVIGATGNVGTALLDALARDADVTGVRAVARRAPERSWPKTTHVRADFTTDDLGPAMRGADAVIHLAWIFQPTHQPTKTWHVNVGGTSRVLDAVVREGVPSPGMAADEALREAIAGIAEGAGGGTAPLGSDRQPETSRARAS